MTLVASLRYSKDVREADVYFEDVPDVSLFNEMINRASHSAQARGV
jgi:non-homologous end joining protein Ku